MSHVVERAIQTRAATPEYEVGFVLTFRRCPACNRKMVCDNELTNDVTGDLVKLEMHCPDAECGEQVLFDFSEPVDDSRVLHGTPHKPGECGPGCFTVGPEWTEYPHAGKGI